MNLQTYNDMWLNTNKLSLDSNRGMRIILHMVLVRNGMYNAGHKQAQNLQRNNKILHLVNKVGLFCILFIYWLNLNFHQSYGFKLTNLNKKLVHTVQAKRLYERI